MEISLESTFETINNRRKELGIVVDPMHYKKHVKTPKNNSMAYLVGPYGVHFRTKNK